MLFGLGIGVLVYAAFVFDLFGFLARDELWLRLLMLAGSALYLIYLYFVADTPLWDALVTDGALAAVNLAMIVVVVIERTTFAMTAEQATLFRNFAFLSPGQFRTLMKLARRVEGAGHTLAHERAPLSRLYFVSSGAVVIEKAGQVTRIDAPAFIGEVAFITRGPASATVRSTDDTIAHVWDHAALDRLFARKPACKVAVAAHLNMDLAHKVARSQPSPAGLLRT